MTWRRWAGPLALAVALTVLLVPLRAQPRAPITLATEDWSARLRGLFRESSRRVVRLVFWGASHTAEDQYTGALRRRLQARFGDGGVGTFPLVAPYSLHRRDGTSVVSQTGLRGITTRRTTGPLELGALGMAVVAERGRARITFGPGQRGQLWARAEGASSSLTLAGPGGPDQAVQVSDTLSEIEFVPGGELTLEVERVRVLGVRVERSTGITIDSAGVPGSRAVDTERWGPTFEAHLARLDVDLVGFAYGTNESLGGGALTTHAHALTRLIERARSAAPAALCVVIGPSATRRLRAGVWQPNPRTDRVRDAYREVARREGCAFVDLAAFQGGDAGLAAWLQRGWLLEDRVHFTDPAHDALAAQLAAEWLD